MEMPLTMFWKKASEVSQKCYPIGAAVELTYRCNETCRFCYIDKGKYNPELTTDQVFFVIKKLVDSGVLFCNLTGGEPFIRDDIVSIIEAVCTSNFFNISIFSNGTLLNNLHIDILTKYKSQIDPFRMTVFSHIDEIHDNYTGVKGGLKKIIENGKILQSQGVKVRLAMPIMDFNLDRLDDSIAFFEKIGFIINLSTAKLINSTNESAHMQNMISKDFFTRYLTSRESEINDVTGNCESPGSSRITSPKFLCRGLKHSITIDPEGNIHPCTSFRNIIYGSIFDKDSIQSILMKNKDYQILSHLTKDDLPCADCSIKQFCNPCIGSWHTRSGSYVVPFEGNCNFAAAIADLYKKK